MNAPPPWTLRGSGLISLASSGTVMLVNYEDSPVGPYRELLFAALGARPRVTHIFVDSPESAAWGRRNWGLPKELAVFDWQDGFVRVEQAGHLLAEFAWTSAGPRIPVTTALLPRTWTTLVQPWEGRVIRTRPEANGRVRPARLTHALVNPARFPDVRPGPALGATDFVMLFPEPLATQQQAPSEEGAHEVKIGDQR